MNGWRCPDWCAGNHQCTAKSGSPSGVHASDPMRWNTSYGSLVAVRYQNLNGRNWIELRATVSLDQAALSGQELASHLAVEVDLAIRSIALAPQPNKPPALAARKGRSL